MQQINKKIVELLTFDHLACIRLRSLHLQNVANLNEHGVIYLNFKRESYNNVIVVKFEQIFGKKLTYKSHDDE